ncbi:inactive phospholipase D5 isoform X2 [Rhinatrema bivittatum]|uniref:inactive phospholipase D5 isoform X2 n=1 Tax=Rhinatrema bivittatum TaxID=194408 RepID=UPI001129933B|nr:inactive phospholipase D5 isoform X2 [Rhinatrema bivittatum]
MSQQKCIVIFALVCCFAVLVALIFSAVDIVGEDEDGISEDNCQNKCRVTLVENIPDGLTYSENATSHLSLFQGWMNLLNMAEKSVDIVSSSWDLCSDNFTQSNLSERQGKYLCEKLKELKSRNIEIKLMSDVQLNTSEVLQDMKKNGVEVQYLNMTAYTEGRLHASFWIVDRKHIYIGSASLDKQSLGQMKELGLILYNCSCLVLDLQRIFALYSSLKYKDNVPQSWSRRLYGLFGKETALKLQLNETEVKVFVSNSPKLFCPTDRVMDVDAIYSVIDDAKRFVYIAVMDYLPLVVSNNTTRYWPDIDGKIREALVLRKIKVRLLISCWKGTHPLTFNFVSSLKAICIELPSCSLEAKFFTPKEQKNMSFPKINRNKYMVTDTAAYIGNFDWVGDDFVHNAGAGLVIKETDGWNNRNDTSIIEQLKAVFERDWYSRHARSLQSNKIPDCLKQRLYRSAPNKTASGIADGKDHFTVY